MNPSRRLSLVTGVFFLITFASAIAGVALYGPVLSDPGYVLGPGADARVILGAICEVVLVLTNIGTALALFPVLRRESEALALGYVAARVMECALILVGVLSLLTVVSLRQQSAGGDEATLTTVGQALVALHDWSSLLGPGLVVGIGNGLLLGYLMYRTGLVPRGLALFGLIGGPLLAVSGIAGMFGLHEQFSAPAFLLALPEMIWEAGLGIYLIVKGFRPSPLVAAVDARSSAAPRAAAL